MQMFTMSRKRFDLLALLAGAIISGFTVAVHRYGLTELQVVAIVAAWLLVRKHKYNHTPLEYDDGTTWGEYLFTKLLLSLFLSVGLITLARLTYLFVWGGGSVDGTMLLIGIGFLVVPIGLILFLVVLPVDGWYSAKDMIKVPVMIYWTICFYIVQWINFGSPF